MQMPIPYPMFMPSTSTAVNHQRDFVTAPTTRTGLEKSIEQVHGFVPSSPIQFPFMQMSNSTGFGSNPFSIVQQNTMAQELASLKEENAALKGTLNAVCAFAPFVT